VAALMPAGTLVVYTRPQCILCAQVKELLRNAEVPFEAIELTASDEQERVMHAHRARSFPLMMLRDRYIGGFTHIVHLLSTGRLAELLAGDSPAVPS
jgi:glutaredoxin